MNTPYTKTEEKLHEARPVLSRSRTDALWERVEVDMSNTKRETERAIDPSASRSVPSPYGAFFHTKVGILATFLIALVVSTSGVALASEPARPGDFLFPVDRAIEDIRLTLARTDDSRDAVLRDMSDERLLELRSIIEEEMVERRVGTRVSETGTTTVRSLQIEADVFTDMTVVKVELNDDTTYFMLQDGSEDEVIRALRERYPFLSTEQVARALNLEYEDRPSRPKDRGEVALPEDGRARVEEALTLILPLLKEGSDTDALMRMLDDEVRGLDIEIDDDEFRVREGKNRFESEDDTRGEEEFEDDDEHEERIEIRENGERIRIEEKDGEVRVRIDDDHSGSDDSESGGEDDDSDARDDRDEANDSSGRNSDESDDTDEEDTDSSGKGSGKDDTEDDTDKDNDSRGTGSGDENDLDEDDSSNS